MRAVDNVETSLSGRKPLDKAAKSERDLLKTDVFDVSESARAKNRCHGRRFETGGLAFAQFLKLFDPLLFYLS